MSELQKIRIKLKAYDHALLVRSEDRGNCQENWRRRFRTDSASDRERNRDNPESCSQI